MSNDTLSALGMPRVGSSGPAERSGNCTTNTVIGADHEIPRPREAPFLGAYANKRRYSTDSGIPAFTSCHSITMVLTLNSRLSSSMVCSSAAEV